MIGFSVFPLFFVDINETLGRIVLCSPGQDSTPAKARAWKKIFILSFSAFLLSLHQETVLLLDPVDPHPLFLHVFTGLLVEMGLSRIGFVVYNAH